MKDTDINNKPQEIQTFIALIFAIYTHIMIATKTGVEATDGSPEKHSFLLFTYIYFYRECQTNWYNIKHRVDSFTDLTKNGFDKPYAWKLRMSCMYNTMDKTPQN